MAKEKRLNIVVPMAGRGSSFIDAGYAFPKPIIDIKGKTMIGIVAENLKPSVPHNFIFICNRDHYEKYDYHNILKNASNNNFVAIKLHAPTHGAAATVLTAVEYIDNDDELLIANADQYVQGGIDAFIQEARKKKADGYIMTFNSSHPKWSYARVDKDGKVLETAEKKVISKEATAGIYYYKKGSDFVKAAQNMIHKDIRHDNQFFVCPAYNEMILEGKSIYIKNIPFSRMKSLATPEDAKAFISEIESGKVII